MTEVEKPQNKPLEAPMPGSLEAETKKLLDKQPKKTVRLYQVPEDSNEEKLPPQAVSVNGYVYQIERGPYIEVPETVFDILHEAGHG
jgi:hypothetical protein